MVAGMVPSGNITYPIVREVGAWKHKVSRLEFTDEIADKILSGRCDDA